MLKWYARNWNYIRQIISENAELFDRGKGKEVKKLVSDLALYQQNEDGIKILQPIASAIDAVQGNNVTLADGLNAWKELLNSFRNSEGREWLAAAETRYNKSVVPAVFVAYSLHPKFVAESLTTSEWNKAVYWIKENRPSCLDEYMSYIGGGKDVIKKMHDLSPNCDLFNFYKSQELLGNLKNLWNWPRF